ncbi:FecR family protein [Echinicola strongylocentroti]|uniref:FecR family protein n=1 Tax=Echinicola strongylocentroti TaxID=1795355 RepID=UPI0013A7083E|nr:FecR domain-containing protein [Echinicola strongylocentroti]
MEKELLYKYLAGTASQSEKAAVIDWLETDEGRAQLESLMQEEWGQEPENIEGTELGRLLTGVHQRIGEATPQKKLPKGKGYNWGKGLRIAASVMLVSLLSVLLYKQLNYSAPILPPEITTYTKHAKVGEKLRLRLPDKTFVILNANSTISYTSGFGRGTREVELEGEAFFEITPDKARPFMVRAGDVVVTALGTAFNTENREGNVSVALTEGKVSVENEVEGNEDSVILLPGQMASVDNSVRGELAVAAFDLEDVTAWKEGRIHFKSKPLGEVLDDLQEWYGVDITSERGVNAARKVSGTFNNENLENVLKGLTFSLGFEYEINNEQVILRK